MSTEREQPKAMGVLDTRFGSFQAEPRDVVTMVDPLPGFESCRRYVLLSSQGIEPFACLQGLDGPQPSFLAIDPRAVEPRYAGPLTPNERQRLEAGDEEPLLWLALVCVREGGASVNLRAPVVVNPRRMVGIQLLPAESVYSTDHPLPVE